MTQIVLKIDGMSCPMCEAHINEAIRNAFPVKKVTSSHKKGETVILCERVPDPPALRTLLENGGYRLLSSTAQTVPEKGLFARFRRL